MFHFVLLGVTATCMRTRIMEQSFVVFCPGVPGLFLMTQLPTKKGQIVQSKYAGIDKRFKVILEHFQLASWNISLVVTLGLVRVRSVGYRAHPFDDDIVTNATLSYHEEVIRMWQTVTRLTAYNLACIPSVILKPAADSSDWTRISLPYGWNPLHVEGYSLIKWKER